MEWYGVSISLLGIGIALIAWALVSQEKINADLRRQIDDLRRELEEMKRESNNNNES